MYEFGIWRPTLLKLFYIYFFCRTTHINHRDDKTHRLRLESAETASRHQERATIVLTVARVGRIVEALVEVGLGLVLQVPDESPSGLVEGGGDERRIDGQRAQVQTETQRVTVLTRTVLLSLASDT